MIKYKVTKSDYPVSHSFVNKICVWGVIELRGPLCLFQPGFVISMWVRRPSHGRPIPILSLSCEESLLFLHIPRQGMPGTPQMWEDRGVAGAHTCSRFWFRSTRSSWFRGDAASLLLGGCIKRLRLYVTAF